MGASGPTVSGACSGAVVAHRDGQSGPRPACRAGVTGPGMGQPPMPESATLSGDQCGRFLPHPQRGPPSGGLPGTMCSEGTDRTGHRTAEMVTADRRVRSSRVAAAGAGSGREAPSREAAASPRTFATGGRWDHGRPQARSRRRRTTPCRTAQMAFHRRFAHRIGHRR